MRCRHGVGGRHCLVPCSVRELLEVDSTLCKKRIHLVQKLHRRQNIHERERSKTLAARGQNFFILVSFDRFVGPVPFPLES